MTLNINVPGGKSEITIKRGALSEAGELLDLNRKVLIVTDSGVPSEYSAKVASFCKQPVTVTIDQGEKSKTLANFELLCKTMLENDFTRSDCCVAVGGGVVTDITGFAAACYMRGITFYNIPTTLLSQVDASVGGKTAVDLCGVKNIVGAFHQPEKVIIDPDTLSTLDRRQFSSGMAEAIKMAVSFDSDLFELMENNDISLILDSVISRSVALKASIVMKDERENGLRRTLNFGHTVGHAVETLSGLLHGESVAVGMCFMCSGKVRERLVPLLKKFDLPVSTDIPADELCKVLIHDKKMSGDTINVIRVESIGTCEIRKMPKDEFIKSLDA